MKTGEEEPGRSRPPRRPIHKFDPLSFAKDLQTTGFTREQAEGLAARVAAEQSAFIDDRLAHEEDIAAVRGDIESLRVSTKADIEALRISMDAKIETTAERTKSEILKWMVFAAIVTQTVVLLAAMIGIMRAGIH
jgi:hypothetical protein